LDAFIVIVSFREAYRTAVTRRLIPSGSRL
jgi:hypothetical protein